MIVQLSYQRDFLRKDLKTHGHVCVTFLHTIGHSKSIIFEHRKRVTFFISLVLIKNVSAT